MTPANLRTPPWPRSAPARRSASPRMLPSAGCSVEVGAVGNRWNCTCAFASPCERAWDLSRTLAKATLAPALCESGVRSTSAVLDSWRQSACGPYSYRSDRLHPQDFASSFRRLRVLVKTPRISNFTRVFLIQNITARRCSSDRLWSSADSILDPGLRPYRVEINHAVDALVARSDL